MKKLTAYEAAGASDETLLVADRNDGYDFEGVIDQLRRLTPKVLRTTDIKRGQAGDERARSALIEALNRGPKLVSYAGHGSNNLWPGNLLTTQDAAGLRNDRSLSVFVLMNV